MSQFVLDTSVVMAWCFEDETNSFADTILERLSEGSAIVPGIWPLEVGNVLVVAERRDRISKADSTRFVTLLRELPIEVDFSSKDRILNSVLNLAREQSISTYDAAYLDLAMQVGIPLATLDLALRSAAERCGVTIQEERFSEE
jgi:predicted nucleic acid-binding protein